MLIVDGEPLNLNKKAADLTETEKWVQETLKEIRKSTKPYVFKAKMKPVKLVDEHGQLHTDHRYYSAPRETTFNNQYSGMTESWQLISSPSGFKKRADGSVQITKEPGVRVSTAGTHLDARRDYEVIFFLKYISMSTTNKRIYLEDKVAEAKKADEELMLQDEALRLISSPQSPISIEVTGSDEVLKQLAISWKVPNVDGMTPSELKINLRKAVITSHERFVETQRGFKEFVDDAHRLGDSDKRSTILLSIERGILEFEDNVWFINNREGGKQLLLSIPPEQVSRKDDWIIKHLVKKDNVYFYELAESLLANPATKTPEVPKQEYDRAEYLRILKEELGWPHAKVFSLKDDKIKERVEKRIRYEE